MPINWHNKRQMRTVIAKWQYSVKNQTYGNAPEKGFVAL
jgi:hypothetical protein